MDALPLRGLVSAPANQHPRDPSRTNHRRPGGGSCCQGSEEAGAHCGQRYSAKLQAGSWQDATGLRGADISPAEIRGGRGGQDGLGEAGDHEVGADQVRGRLGRVLRQG